MSKVITEENLKTLDLIKELFSEEIKTNDILRASLADTNRYPLIVRKLLEKGEPFCFENEGEIPFIESSYKWELRMPNKKIEYAFNRFELPVSFKSSLNYLDEYTQKGFKFFIRYNSNESLTLLVDDLKFDKKTDSKRILVAYYDNTEKNIHYCLEVVINDYYLRYFVNTKGSGTYGKSRKLSEEIKNRYGIEVADRPLPY